MLIEILLATLLGVFVGTITGLIPGIHINLISASIITYSVYLLGFFDSLALAVFIISMSVTHTFMDSIPSIFLGAPDSDHALGVLPGHRLLLKGFGFAAVYLTLIGSLYGLFLAIVLFPILIKFIGFIYPIIQDYIGYLLVLVVSFMILREKKKVFALLLFLYSGILGLLVLNLPNISNPLFPMLSGLFGISTLIISLSENNEMPIQRYKKIVVNKFELAKSVLASTLVGSLTAFLPGVGPAQGAVVAKQIVGRIKQEAFLILIGTLNTVNMIVSLATLYVIEKARNGSVIAISQLLDINSQYVIILLLAVFISGIISFFLAQKITKVFSNLVQRINYVLLVKSIILFLGVMTLLLSGPIGLLILITSSAIGLIAPKINVSRTHAMGCLLIPVMSYFLL